MKRYMYLILMCALALISSVIQAQDANGILYVKSGGAGSGLGDSWTNATAELADALRTATSLNNTTAGTVKQIWVAKGTYSPKYPANDVTGGTATNTDRTNAFVLLKDVKIYGGFAGTETDTTARDFTSTANASILSGDLGTAGDNSDNAFHVLLVAGNMGSAIISGFTVTGGNANTTSGTTSVNGYSFGKGYGGGISIGGTTALFMEDMTFSNNIGYYGGAISINGSNASNVAMIGLRRVNILNNTSLNLGGAMYLAFSTVDIDSANVCFNTCTGNYGGGMFVSYASNVNANRLHVNDNNATGSSAVAGGIYVSNVSAVNMTNSELLRDTATASGALLYENSTAAQVFKNVKMSGGYGGGTGSVVYCSPNTNLTFINTLITGNKGVAVYIGSGTHNFINTTISGNGTGIYPFGGAVNIQNSIIYGNTTAGIQSGSGTVNSKYSTIQGATDDATNHITSANPLFKSPSAQVAPFTDGDYSLQNSSPAKDAGNDALYTAVSGYPTTDLAGAARFNGTIDQGAYETPLLQSQTITALADTAVTYSDVFTRIFSASSGLAVTVASADNSIAEAYQDVADGNKWKIKTKKAGTVNITVSQPGNATYAAAANVVFALTINKAALTITAKDSAMKYTGVAFAGGNGITYSGFVNGEDSTVALTGSLTYSGTSQSATGAGTYTIIPAGLTADNYTITFVSGSLTIQLAYSANGIIYVKKGSTGAGSSWSDAVGEVSEALRSAALMNAASAGTVKQIWVAKGTYSPKYPANDVTGGTATNTDRTNAFVLLKDVKIYGGFAGNESDTTGRDFITNATVLSGDIGANGSSNDNTYHVVVAAGDMGQALISGFTISDAYAEVTGSAVVNGVNIKIEQGGGITVRSAALLIEDVVLTNNYSSNGAGAAVYAASGDVMASAVFRRVTILKNSGLTGGAGIYATYANVQIENTTGSFNKVTSATGNGGMLSFAQSATVNCRLSSFNDNRAYGYGGALYCSNNAVATFYKTEFLRDTTQSGGGAFSTTSTANVLFENCTIKGCVSNTFMGAAYVNGSGSVVTLVNSLVTGNYNTSSSDFGIIRVGGGTLKVINSTISGNNKTAIINVGSSATIFNSVIYGNGGGVQGTYSAKYSTIQAATADAVNHVTNTDPLFVSSNAYTTAPSTGGDYSLQATSPALNAGDNSLYNDTATLDLAGNMRIMGTSIDQGAYELQLPSQTITSLADTAVTYGSVFTRAFAASSGLTVALSSADNSIAEAYQDAADGNIWKIKAKKVGTVNITMSQPGNASYAPAANATFALTVNTAALTITAKDSSKVYDGVAYSGGNGVTYSGFVSGDDSTAALTGTLTYSGTSQGAKNVNTYVITPGGLTAANYAITYVNGALTITKAALTITAKDSAKVYDGVAYSGGNGLSYSGFVNNEDSTAVLTGAVTYSGTSQGAVHTGNYVITPGGFTAINYTITYVNGTLTINKATLSVTADAQTKAYGSADPALTYTATGLAGSDNTSLITGALTRDAGEDVGVYAITQGTLSANADYTIAYTGNYLTITKATNTITFTTQTAGATITKVYGSAGFDASATATSGLTVTYSSINTAVATVTSSGQVQIVGAGTTTITASQAGNASYNAATDVSFILQVTPASLIITANGYSKTYDAVAYSGGNGIAFSGFVNNETTTVLTGTLSYSGTSQGAKAAGSYVITPGGYTSANYSITYLNGTLTISPAALTIQANAQTKVYGTSDPTLTYTATGFAGSDNTSMLTGTLSRVAGENVGTYAINQNTLSAGGNYTISYTGNTFTITKATQTITWVQDLTTGCNGAAAITLNATTNNGLPVSYSVVNTAIATVSGSTLTPANTGSTQVTASQAGDANHFAATAVTNTFNYLLSSMVRQHWSDALFFDNTGGTYVQWQWYKNSAAVAGATSAYYSESTALNGTYYAIVTDQNGKAIQTCPLTVTGSSTVAGGIKAYPNPANPASTVTITCNYTSTELQGARLMLTTVGGTTLKQLTSVQTTNQFTMPVQSGIYIVILLLGNGQKATANVFVN